MIEFLQLIEIVPVQWFSLAITLLGLGSFIFAGIQIKIMKQNKKLQQLLIQYLEDINNKGGN